MHAHAGEMAALHSHLCKAIADPKRLMMLDTMRDGPVSVTEIAERLGLSQPNTSQHLAILRERNVVQTSRSGTTVYYALTSPKVLAAVDLLREFMSEFMTVPPGRSDGAPAGSAAAEG